MKKLCCLITLLACLTSCSGEKESSVSVSEAASSSINTTQNNSVSTDTSEDSSTAEQEEQTESVSESSQSEIAEEAASAELSEDYFDKCKEYIRTEKVNGIAIGTEYDDVLAALGEPSSEESPYTSDDGEMYPMAFCDDTIKVVFVSENDVKTVNTYSFNESSNAITDSGIAIGNSRQDVIDIYGDRISVEESIPLGEYDKYENTPETLYILETIRIGSYKYGQLSFSFDENDKLVRIYASDITSM